MNTKTKQIAKRFSIYDRIKTFENELLKIDGIIEIDFDLSGFFDNLEQVIFLTKYNISCSIDMYYQEKRRLIAQIISVSQKNGLQRAGDPIEDYGEHLYFVMSCAEGWR